MKLLTRAFYQRDTLIVAQELIGKILVRKINGHELRGRIVETEAYRPSLHPIIASQQLGPARVQSLS